MEPTPCPVCGDTSRPKFDTTSDWCTQCVDLELLDQSLEDTYVVQPEVI